MATAIRGMPGSEFEPRRPLQKHHPIGWCFFVCASALTVVSAGCRRLPQPTAGTLPRKRLASSAAGGASALSSSPAPKRIPHPTGWGILFGMCRSTGELAASTCAKRVKSRGEAGLLRMATAIRGMPGSEFEPRRPLQKHHPIGWCFFVCASALTVVSAGCRRLPQPTAGTLPRKRLASSAAGGASALSSSPAPKKKDTHAGCLSFLEQHFCYAKVVACGRVTEREWGNPSKVPPSHSPFLAVGGSADNKTCEQPQNTTLSGGVFFVCASALAVVSAS